MRQGDVKDLVVSSSSSESERGGVGARTLEVEPVGLPRFLKGREDMGRRRGAWGGERGDSLFWFEGVRLTRSFWPSWERRWSTWMMDGVWTQINEERDPSTYSLAWPLPCQSIPSPRPLLTTVDKAYTNMHSIHPALIPSSIHPMLSVPPSKVYFWIAL